MKSGEADIGEQNSGSNRRLIKEEGETIFAIFADVSLSFCACVSSFGDVSPNSKLSACKGAENVVL